jgi:hypothetical protein
VARELSPGHELGQRQLLQAMSAAQQLGQRRTGPPRPTPARPETDAQAREQRLAEGPHIQHRRIRHQSLHGRDRMAVMTEFAVVIVLDDPAAAFTRACNERQAARQGEHRAGRILVRRRHMDQPWRPAPGARVNDDALVVDRHGTDLHIACMEGGTHPAVAGIFQPGALARVGEEPHAQRQRPLGALGHHHLGGLATHPARHPQVLRDGLTQGRLAQRIAVGQRHRPRPLEGRSWQRSQAFREID